MRIVFMGTPEFAVNTLVEVSKFHQVVGVFTNPDKPFGRKQEIVFSFVKKKALELNLKVFQPVKFDENAVKILKELNPEAVVVVAYGKILPKEVLEVPKYGCFNVHASLLPKYRGAAPIQASIINGEEKTGVSIIQMTPGLDDGDVLKVLETPIEINQTHPQLSKKLSELGAKAICEVLEDVLNGTLKRTPQNEEEKSYVFKIKKEMGKIDFNKDAFFVHKLICGLCSWPVAYCFLKEKMLKVYKSILKEDLKGEPGEILDEKNLIVACKKGAVEFLEVQLQGGKKMKAKDFLNGHKLKKGSFLK